MSDQFRSDTTDPSVVHRQSSPHYGILDDNVYLPVNHTQLRDLIGRVLTHLDAMGLPDRAHRAARTLLIREVWQWWNGAYENATTSYQGSIAPVVTSGTWNPDSAEAGKAPSNRWGWPSEDAYLAAASEGDAAPAVAVSVDGRQLLNALVPVVEQYKRRGGASPLA